MIKPVPWDSAAFGAPSWELALASEACLREADALSGHQSVKVDPLADKQALHEHGFYYCDTLIETHGTPARLPALAAPAALSVALSPEREATLAICNGAFAHGRFQRDFNVPHAGAERRYANWLEEMLAKEQVYGLYADGALGGFIAVQENKLVLHAVAQSHRGRGLAKYWWHLVVSDLFARGHASVGSSISASNMAVLNLYASLGFSFQHPQDIYHRYLP